MQTQEPDTRKLGSQVTYSHHSVTEEADTGASLELVGGEASPSVSSRLSERQSQRVIVEGNTVIQWQIAC